MRPVHELVGYGLGVIDVAYGEPAGFAGSLERQIADPENALLDALIHPTSCNLDNLDLSYCFAERIAAVLGETAMDVVIRLWSFILVCIGVQISWNGLSTLLRSILTR